jgi:hypothetical protein
MHSVVLAPFSPLMSSTATDTHNKLITFLESACTCVLLFWSSQLVDWLGNNGKDDK